MSKAESKQLAQREYWDERYNKVSPDEQVHEWFRSFNDLLPFLDRHLFQIRGPKTAPMILHLGSGDSVSVNGWLHRTDTENPKRRQFLKSSPEEGMRISSV